jgi:hypothetical protein
MPTHYISLPIYSATAKTPATTAVPTPVQNVLPRTLDPTASPLAGDVSTGLGLAGGKLVLLGTSVRFCTVIQLALKPIVRFAASTNALTLNPTLLSSLSPKPLYASGIVKFCGSSIKINVYECGMSPTGGLGWRYGTGLLEGMMREAPVVFAEMGEERVMFVAIQWMSWTRVLLRGTSRSTMRRIQDPGPEASVHHTGEEIVGRVAVSGRGC